MTSTGRRLAFVILVAIAAPAAADELLYEISGVADPIKANVLAHVTTVQLGRQARLADKDFPEVIENSSRRAREALRPYGFYAPVVRGRITRRDRETLVLTLEIDRGPPMVIAAANVEIEGDGVRIKALREWRDGWPLKAGATLDQAMWESQKGHALELAEARGFLAAEFTTSSLELDLVKNTARLKLVLDTGPRYVFGDIDYGVHVLKPGILQSIPRFDKGAAYSARLLDKFRTDLWKTGYFTNVEIEEIPRPGTTPPQVDLQLKLETTHKNSYQGSLGFGSDTGIRLQAQWSRHPVSRNGDRLDVGLGWQELDDEMSIRTNYRLPRLTRQRQYWTANLTVKIENTDLEIKRTPEDKSFIKVANGDIADYHLRLGRLKVRNLKEGDRQLFGTTFVQYLNSDQRYELVLPISVPQGEFRDLANVQDDAVSVGYEADLVDVWGKSFDVQGRRDRGWVFVSDESFGSSSDFAQVYLATRRIYRKGDRWKFHVRGEVGYTDAQVDNLEIDVDGSIVDLSLTRLPNFYRFKAGGSHSVRGYGFESLNDNDIGSNHIATASVEVEMRFFENWSAAAFFDIGNAFNDWSKPNLHKGAGIGLRWYSIAGPIRIDVAQALDFSGRPWRVHFTIGTPLL